MEVNFNYEYLFLNDLQRNNYNNTLIYKLDDNSNCISTKSQKWFINMELLEFMIPYNHIYNYIYDLNPNSKIYILINELKSNDNLKYHFACKTEKTTNGIMLKPLNLYNFNTNKICLTTPKLTFSLYIYCKESNKLEYIFVEQINSLPMELIIKYKI